VPGEPAPGAGNTALACPACGASLEYDGVSPVVRCTYCGNSIVVASLVAAPARPAAPPQGQEDAFAEEVRLLVEGGETDQAIDLLRQRLSLPLADAKSVVALFEAGNYGRETQIIAEAVRRRGGQAPGKS